MRNFYHAIVKVASDEPGESTMHKPFDTTIRQLLDERGDDWLPWLGPLVGLPATIQADPHGTAFTSINVQADKVFKLRAPHRGILHLEAQASWDDDLLSRLLLYNVQLWYHNRMPIHTIVLLLRREANMPDLTGRMQLEWAPGINWLDFTYRVVRLWELPASTFLNGGVGTLPLALLTDDAATQIPVVMREIDQRLKEPGISHSSADLIWQMSYWLMGLRFDNIQINDWFKGVPGMEESSTYQFVLAKGESKGEAKGIVIGAVRTSHNHILSLLRKRFGTVPANLEQQIRQVTEADRLDTALLSIVDLKSIDEFQV